MLQLQNAAVSYGSEIILQQISLAFSGKDRKAIGLLGDNGAGKTSLFQVLRGELEPSEGTRTFHREFIAYIPQDIALPQGELVGEYLESFLEEPWMLYKIDKILADVGLSDEILIRTTDQLSGGERMRIFIAKELLSEPTIFLLDEPTNHLDVAGLTWLGNFLRSFKGSSVTITHDRWFINEYLTDIWYIDRTSKSIETYTGNYDQFLVWKAEREERQRKQFELEQAHMKEIEQWLKRFEFHPKYRFSSVVMSRKRALANAKRRATHKLEEARTIAVGSLEGTVKDQRFFVVEIENHPYITGLPVSFQLRSHETMQLAGPNGSGKSTLMKLLQQPHDEDGVLIEHKDGLKVGLLGQHMTLDQNKSVLQVFEDGVKEQGLSESLERSILHSYYFLADDLDKRVQEFSLGEQRKLQLAILLANKPQVLLLDEPTNHMDIITREIIEHFIVESNIPVVLISHDRYFIEKVSPDKVITLG